MFGTSYNYQWEPGGMDLLNEILVQIHHNGGIDRTIDLIQAEWTKDSRCQIKFRGNQKLWSKEDEQFLIDNHESALNRSIAKMLNRSEHSVKSKIQKLIGQGRLTQKIYY